MREGEGRRGGGKKKEERREGRWAGRVFKDGGEQKD